MTIDHDDFSTPTHRPRAVHSATDEDMLTVEEASAYLRVPAGTLRYWRHLGCGPKSFKVGRHVRYWKADVRAWLSHCSSYPQDGGIHLPNPRTEGGR